MSDSEVSIEAESGKMSAKDPQVDCVEEAEKGEESLSEDVKEESVDSSRGGGSNNEVMYDIDINSDEENAVNSEKDVQKVDKGIWSEHVEACCDGDAVNMSGSVANEGHRTNHHSEKAEAPEGSGESHIETKVMCTFIIDNQPLQGLLCCRSFGLSMLYVL